ncbi:MAG: hypothetical protein IJ523_03580 [Succinivibrionaceae bacterium]|nr:hypothetical protein [Succinivibrionaceae bacterium]
MKNSRRILATALALAAVLLTACSFRLRGLDQSGVTSKFTSIQIRGDKDSQLYQELYALLNTTGLPIVDAADEGTITVAFSGPTFKKSLVSVDSRSLDVEYSISSKTVYYFISNDKPEAQQKPKRRLAGYTRNNLNKNEEVLGSANESQLLQNELVKQTAEDIYIHFLRLSEAEGWN